MVVLEWLEGVRSMPMWVPEPTLCIEVPVPNKPALPWKCDADLSCESSITRRVRFNWTNECVVVGDHLATIYRQELPL